MKYALLSYVNVNIGDEIQSLAARRFLPQVDLLLDRDRPSEWRVDEPTKLILNGWFKCQPDDWPIRNEAVEPLFISFHISDEHGSSQEALLTPDALRFYKRHEPVGCRDQHTATLLSRHGVRAYFSGCLTLTLRKPAVPPSNVIVLVDVPPWVEDHLAPGHGARVVHVSHLYRGNARFQHAASLLALYASARLVVSSRLHCVLPCLAFDTPVAFVRESFDDPRFGGLRELLPCTRLGDLQSRRKTLSREAATADGSALRELQNGLIAACEQFVH